MITVVELHVLAFALLEDSELPAMGNRSFFLL